MVLLDFVQNVFLFDTTLYKTLAGLLIHPGDLVKSYLGGKKKKYLQPFQFFLLFMTIYLLVLNFFGDSFFDSINSGFHIESTKISKVELIQSLVRKNLNVLYFILTPIIAFYLSFLYKKSKFNYAEMLIFALYIVGTSLLLSSIVILVGQFNAKLFILKSIIIIGYFPFAIIQFTNSKSLLGILKALSTIILSYITFVLIIVLIAGIYVYGLK
ncbi:MAG: DUF3667 domain-containing protein [Flavobacteriales bacterium]|nr:DUF3667 domain-containing protein [Flavobacteriales bacterium]MCB9364745.1 DUF3667 domain-containing protein [Flavobacteriales bacterium]